MNSVYKTILFLTLAISLTSSAFAQNVIGDWDNDGRSDIAVAVTYPASQINIPYVGTDWLLRLSNGNSRFYHFSTAADALITGRYFSDSKIYPGVIKVVGLTTPLQWTIKTPNGGEVVVDYGLPGDRIMNQGDIDCDGITDFAVTRQGSGVLSDFMYWYVALSGSGGAVVETLFGMKDDIPFLADRGRDGCADLFVLRKGTWQWFSRKLLDETTVRQVQWGLPGDFPLLPQDLNGDGKTDYAISRITGEKQTIYVRYSGSNTKATAFDIPKNAIPMLGKFRFTDRSSLAFWNRSTGGLTFVKTDGALSNKSFGIATNILVRPDGTVVQPSESARVEGPSDDSGSTGGDTGGDSGQGGGSGEVPPGLSAVCSTVIPFSAGSLWKPSSQDTNDARENKPVILYNRSIPSGNSCLPVYASNGQTVADMGVWEYNGRYGGRWYAGHGCGDGKTGSQMATDAQNSSGSASVYVQREPGVCVGPFDPRKRNGGLA